MNFNHLFQMQGMLFSLMLVGLFLKRTGIIPESGKDLLTDLVIYVTLPCSIIKSFQMEFNWEILKNCLVIAIVAVLIQIGSWILSVLLYPGMEDKRKKVLQYATICSNAGILGNPIAEGIFGLTGQLYASIYVIPQRIFMWSVGLSYFTEAPDKKTLLKKVSTHPCILAVAAGLFILVTQIPLPDFVTMTIHSLAGANTALAMLLVGIILSGVRFRDLADKQTLYYTLIRLVVLPFLVFLACRLAKVDWLVTGVSVTLSGMPAASVTAAMAAKYHKDEVFATKCVVFSTIVSMVTIPIWCIVLV